MQMRNYDNLSSKWNDTGGSCAMTGKADRELTGYAFIFEFGF